MSLQLLSAGACFGEPFTTATVTKIENRVLLGERPGETSVTRAAAEKDVMRARNFLRCEKDSQAELRFSDGSVVRLGQNTVFTFDTGSRTVTLDHGSLLFNTPKNSGGGIIKTASLTAAVNTAVSEAAGKVSDNVIAMVKGRSSWSRAGMWCTGGEFCRRNPDGSITVARSDPGKVLEGKLIDFNGPMPGFR